ncbi:hypothetical protein C4N9_17820 [Pararhodobacter marinus]|uniref:Uncharacterized protein n=1 Tax=Pararhodobacter marinus TaxID=2184063 RepID=A0A2U2C5U3_9RHOB|nr:hypothetical protein [Pararhodobacter marinus]PWE27164.1 hypothetical protein C4N9_17820 [Pararhodobacter marinus]
MMSFLSEYSGLIEIGSSLLMALIWILYLQLFWNQLQRQRRTELLIQIGGKPDSGATIIVTNLGLEPVALQEILLTVPEADGEGEHVAAVSQKGDGVVDGSKPQHLGTGTLNSGASLDVGPVTQLFRRLSQMADHEITVENVSWFRITLVAITASNTEIAAAERAFEVEGKGASLRILPTSITARQIRNRRERRSLDRTVHTIMRRDSVTTSPRSRRTHEIEARAAR